MYIGNAGSVPIGVNGSLAMSTSDTAGVLPLSWCTHNRQAKIAILAVCSLFTGMAGLAAVFTGTDKQAAECVPIVQENGGLSVYQALGGTDAAVPPKRVER